MSVFGLLSNENQALLTGVGGIPSLSWIVALMLSHPRSRTQGDGFGG